MLSQEIELRLGRVSPYHRKASKRAVKRNSNISYCNPIVIWYCRMRAALRRLLFDILQTRLRERYGAARG